MGLLWTLLWSNFNCLHNAGFQYEGLKHKCQEINGWGIGASDIKAQILFQISEITLLKVQYWEYNRATKSTYLQPDKEGCVFRNVTTETESRSRCGGCVGTWSVLTVPEARDAELPLLLVPPAAVGGHLLAPLLGECGLR